jgi:hypothetical protein
MGAKQIPDALNDVLVAISLALGFYSVLRWREGGGIVWQIVLGICAYFFVAGLYQKFVKKKTASGTREKHK